MTIDYVAELRSQADQFIECVEAGPLDAAVAACPGWDLQKLAGHMAYIHRWAAGAVCERAMPDGAKIPEAPSDQAALVRWLRDGVDALIEVLAATPVDAPTWHPFPAPLLAGVWRRRQMQELVIHRWDAQHAIGRTATIIPTIASDGIDEYITMMLQRRIVRDGGTLPTSSLHVHCVDTPGEWLLWTENHEVRFRREHARGDAALRGTAESLDLTLWGRRHPRLQYEIVGDEGVAEQWLALGG